MGRRAPSITHPESEDPTRVREDGAGIAVPAALTHDENTSFQLREQVVSIPGVRALMNGADPALGIPSGFWDHMEGELVRPEFRQVVEQGVRIIAEARPPTVSGIIPGWRATTTRSRPGARSWRPSARGRR